MFNPSAELLIPIEIRAKEAKAGMEKHAVTKQANIKKGPI